MNVVYLKKIIFRFHLFPKHFRKMSKGKGKNAQPEPEPEPVKIEPEIKLGSGKFSLIDNSSYEGQYKEINGIKFKDGKGIFKVGPEIYDGNWVMDIMSGYGEYYFSSGAVYKGNFDNNQLHGEGSYQFSDGASYTGSWSNNKMHGKGTYISPDLSVFEGEFFNGMYNTGRTYISLRGAKKS